MTRQIIIYIFCSLTIISHGQKTNSGKTKDTLNAPTIELKVKLIDNIDKIKLPPDCGIFEVNSTTLKYKVLNVIHGDFKAKTVLINHRCIKDLVDRKIIENKKTYTFKLRPQTTQAEKKINKDNLEYEVLE